MNVSIPEGEGILDGKPVSGGDYLLLTAGYGKLSIEGDLELIWSYI